MLKQYNAEISKIMNLEDVTYDDFRWFVKRVLSKTSGQDFENVLGNGSFIYERRLKELYDQELFKNFPDKRERFRRIIKILWEILDGNL